MKVKYLPNMTLYGLTELNISIKIRVRVVKAYAKRYRSLHTSHKSNPHSGTQV